MRNYQQLEVWKIGMQLAKEVFVVTRQFPKEEVFGLTSQIKRACVSIPSNIAEGMGRQYKKDTLQFLHIARGSIYELETELDISVQVACLSQKEYEQLSLLLESTLKLLNGLINYTLKADLK